MATRPNFSDWLIDQLKKKDMSLSELSRISEVSRQTIYSYLRDEASNPSIAVLDRIARALLVSPQEIYWAAGLVSDEPGVHKEIDEMMQVFRQLSNDDQQRMIEIGRALLPFKKKKPISGDNAGG